MAELKYIIKEEEYRKEKFNVYEFYFKCENTSNEFTTPEIGDVNLLQLYNQYRERKNILFPEQIKEMRLKYGLSAARMSELLGFGVNTYSNYEKGEIPNDSNSTLLNVANEPDEFKKSIVSKKENLFSKNQLKNLYDKIDKLIQEKISCSLFNLIWNKDTIPNKFTGFKTPDFNKFAHTVIYFIREPHTFVTRLNKYLFYSDFLNFKNTGYSITGIHYAAIPQGPVPNNYDYLYNLLLEEKFIGKEEVPINDNEIYERYKPAQIFDQSLFSKEELNSLKTVMDRLCYMKTKDIIDLSHEEKAWTENQANKDLISYQDFGFELKGI
jgi:putative zinc finger/helix-turn-helix YgiT family protein